MFPLTHRQGSPSFLLTQTCSRWNKTGELIKSDFDKTHTELPRNHLSGDVVLISQHTLVKHSGEEECTGTSNGRMLKFHVRAILNIINILNGFAESIDTHREERPVNSA